MKKTREIEKYLQYRRKIRVVKYAQDFGARDTCETFGEDFNCNVIELKEKYSLLQKSEYEEVADEMIVKQQELWF